MRTLFWLACLALIFALALPGCTTPTKGTATEAADGTVIVVVSAARVATCRANGGCGLYSQKELLKLAEAAAEVGARQSCPAKQKAPL